MKSGKLSGRPADNEPYYPYWVMPDKPQMQRFSPNSSGTFTTEWDAGATATQTDSIKKYLANALGDNDTWVENNHRFYFQKEDDWEMFKTMCMLGWQ